MPDRGVDLDSMITWFDKYINKLNLLLAIARNGVAPQKFYRHLQQVVRPINGDHMSSMHQRRLLTEQHNIYQPEICNDALY